jgi:ABC-type Fe3+/spermidine/putrescine transport system ATPase subunit
VTTSPDRPPSESPPAVRLHDVSFSYGPGEAFAVNAVDLEVQHGELLGIVGPSGCGKSTVLRLIAGLLAPTSGHISLRGRDATRLRPERRDIGWVPQSYALFDHLDVADNVAYGLRARRWKRAAIDARVEAVLSMCRIGELASRRIGELSGGQRQRVAIARALAPEPAVLLLDEPLAALDPQLRSNIRMELSNVLRQSSTTVVMVTHDQREAMSMADRVLVMRNGFAVQLATPLALWNEPREAFVAEFLSDAVVVAAHLTGSERVVGTDIGLRFDSRSTGRATIRELVLRPGDVVVDEGANGSCVVVDCAYIGGVHHAQCRLPDGSVVVAESRLARRVDERVGLRWREGYTPTLLPMTDARG